MFKLFLITSAVALTSAKENARHLTQLEVTAAGDIFESARNAISTFLRTGSDQNGQNVTKLSDAHAVSTRSADVPINTIHVGSSGGRGLNEFRSNTTSVNADCTPTKPDHLILWQIYSDMHALVDVNKNNRHFLPEGSQIQFIEHHWGMMGYAQRISNLLERCAHITGFYAAFRALRPVAFRSDLLRLGLLWAYGGLYMDHKEVLMEPLGNFINLDSDAAVLPLDDFYFSISDSYPVHNSILYSRSPRHEVFEYIIRLQIQNVKNRYYGPDVRSITGPLCYGLALDYYLGNETASTDASVVRDIVLSSQNGKHHLWQNPSDFLYVGSFFKIDGLHQRQVAVWHEGLHVAGREV